MLKSDGARAQQARRPKIANPFAGTKDEKKSLIALMLHVYRTIFCDVEEALYDIRYPRPARDLAFMDLEYEGTGCGKHIHKIISDSRSRFREIIMSQFREFRKILEKHIVELMKTGASADTLTKLLDKRTEMFGIMVPSEDEPLTGDPAFLRDYLVFAAKYREWLAACCVDYSVYQKYVYRRILADVEEYPDVMKPVVEMGAKDKALLEELFEEMIEAVKQRRPVDLLAASILNDEEEDAPRYNPAAPEPKAADIISTAYSLVHWLVKFLIVIRQLQEGIMAVLIRNSLGESILQVPRRRGEAHLCVKLLLLTGITVNIDVTSILKTCREDFADMSYKCLYVLLHKGVSELSFVTSLEEGQNIVEDGLAYFERFSELRPLLVQRRGTARSKFRSLFFCLGKRHRTSLGHHEFRSPIKPKHKKGGLSRQDQGSQQQFYAIGRYSQGRVEEEGVTEGQQKRSSSKQREVFTLTDDFTPMNDDGDGAGVASRRMSAMSHFHQDELSGKKQKKKKGCSIM